MGASGEGVGGILTQAASQVSEGRLGFPGVKDGDGEVFEVADVAGNDGEAVVERRGGDQTVGARGREVIQLRHHVTDLPAGWDRRPPQSRRIRTQ